MPALDYSRMAGQLMSAAGGKPSRPALGNDGGGNPPANPWQGAAPQPSTLPPPGPPPALGAASPMPSGLPIDPTQPVGPSTAPGVPVLPQEGGSMADMFQQVMSSLSASPRISGQGGIAGTGVPSPGSPVLPNPGNAFDAQASRYQPRMV